MTLDASRSARCSLPWLFMYCRMCVGGRVIRTDRCTSDDIVNCVVTYRDSPAGQQTSQQAPLWLEKWAEPRKLFLQPISNHQVIRLYRYCFPRDGSGMLWRESWQSPKTVNFRVRLSAVYEVNSRGYELNQIAPEHAILASLNFLKGDPLYKTVRPYEVWLDDKIPAGLPKTNVDFQLYHNIPIIDARAVGLHTFSIEEEGFEFLLQSFPQQFEISGSDAANSSPEQRQSILGYLDHMADFLCKSFNGERQFRMPGE